MSGGAGQEPGRWSRGWGRSGGRRAAWRRRVLRKVAAAVSAAVAAAVVVGVVTPHPPAQRLVVVAVRTMAAGAAVTPGDVALRPYGADVVPAGALTDPGRVVGQRVAGPMGAGEIVTSARLVGPGLLAELPAGTVAVQVPTPSGGAAVLRPGRRVDGYVAGRTGPVVRDALVLAVVRDPGGAMLGGAAEGGTGVVLAVASEQAASVLVGPDPAGGPVVVSFAVR